jgi:phosphonate transport system substrate-binding protein
LFAPADYNGVIQGLLGGTLDMAWLGASGYAAVYLQNPEAVEPVLVKINLDGSYGYHSIGFARKDSGITSLEDMAGKVFGFGDPNSTSGYLIPSIEIPQHSDKITMQSGEYFGEVKFTGGHEQTIVAVNNGDIDGGVTWADGQGNWEDGYNSGALRKAVDAGLVDMNDLVEIWRSKPIPEGPVVLRKDLPADVKAKMTAYVDGLFESDPECAYGVAAGESLGFDPITHDAYVSIVEARKAKSN